MSIHKFSSYRVIDSDEAGKNEENPWHVDIETFAPEPQQPRLRVKLTGSCDGECVSLWLDDFLAVADKLRADQK